MAHVTHSLLVVGAAALAACAGSHTSAPPPAADGGAPASACLADSSPQQVLALVDGAAVMRQDLDKDVHRRMDDLENESAQRKFHLLWAGAESVVADRLIAKEAARRRVSVDDLRQAEIAAKVALPSDEDLKKVYDEQVASSGVPFEQASAYIRSQLMTERMELQERSFVEQLRAGADVRYTLPVPELPRFAVETGAGPSLGPPEAKVTLVEFSDFQCPYCARASAMVRRLRELYPKALRVEFREFPLQQHPEARAAAEAARCADEQGKFWEFHDLLFANQRAQKTDDLERYGSEAKLDLVAWKSCLASGRAQKAVRAAEDAGRRNNVAGTPALYINGIKLVGLLPMPLLQSLIDNELRR